MTKQEYMDITYYADFYYKGIIIELKSVEEIVSDHRAQLFNYMRITKHHRGILFNFGEIGLHSERYLYLPVSDDFILLNQDNYKSYIEKWLLFILVDKIIHIIHIRFLKNMAY